jgi:cytochrome c551/c552
MATDPQSLLQQASCYSCNGANLYTLKLMEIALLAQISLSKNPSNDVSPQGLLKQAACLECYASNIYTQNLMILALLQQIAGP